MTTTTSAIGIPPTWCGPYIGLPFVERGRERAGLDCYGLIKLVYAEVFGVTLPSYAGRYETTKDRLQIAKLFFEETTSARWHRVALSDLEPPDVMQFSIAGHAHVGMLVAAGRFLHVLPGRETCIERLHPHWASRCEAAYRHPGLRR